MVVECLPIKSRGQELILPAGGQEETITSDPLYEKVSTTASIDFLVSSLHVFMNSAKNDSWKNV